MSKVFAIAALIVLALGASVQGHAAKEKFERTKPHVNIGTIGHASDSKARTTTTNSSGAQTVKPEHAGNQAQ
jgi:hypothetical protein